MGEWEREKEREKEGMYEEERRLIEYRIGVKRRQDYFILKFLC